MSRKRTDEENRRKALDEATVRDALDILRDRKIVVPPTPKPPTNPR